MKIGPGLSVEQDVAVFLATIKSLDTNAWDLYVKPFVDGCSRWRKATQAVPLSEIREWCWAYFQDGLAAVEAATSPEVRRQLLHQMIQAVQTWSFETWLMTHATERGTWKDAGAHISANDIRQYLYAYLIDRIDKERRNAARS